MFANDFPKPLAHEEITTTLCNYYLYLYYNNRVIIKEAKPLKFLKSFILLAVSFLIFPLISQNPCCLSLPSVVDTQFPLTLYNEACLK